MLNIGNLELADLLPFARGQIGRIESAARFDRVEAAVKDRAGHGVLPITGRADLFPSAVGRADAIEASIIFDRIEPGAFTKHESRVAEFGLADLLPSARIDVGPPEAAVGLHGVEPVAKVNAGECVLPAFDRADALPRALVSLLIDSNAEQTEVALGSGCPQIVAAGKHEQGDHEEAGYSHGAAPMNKERRSRNHIARGV